MTSGLTSIGMTSGDQPTFDTWPSGRASRSATSSGRWRPTRRTRDRRRSAQMPRTTSSRSSVCDVDGVRGAEPPRRLEPRRVAGQPGDDQRVGAGQRRHARAQQADRAGAEHDDEIARRIRRVDAHRVVGHRVRLGQARDLERQRVGDVVQAARRHADVLRHRAVDAVAESLARGAQVVAARAAHQARRRRSRPPSR